MQAFHQFKQTPLEDVFRVPKPRLTLNRFFQDASILINHLLPAYVADTVSWLLNKKPRLIRIYAKIFKAVDSLEYFTTREWDFQTKAMIQIWDRMSEEDKKMFNFDIRQLNWNHYLEMYMLGVKKYIFKEDMSNLPEARKQFNRWVFSFVRTRKLARRKFT